MKTSHSVHGRNNTMIWKCEISKNQSVPNLKYSCQVFVTPSFWFFDILQKTSMFKREPWMAYTRDHGWKVGGNGMIKSFLDFSWIYWNQYYIVGYYILPSFFHILVYRVEFVFLLWLHKVKFGTLCNCWVGWIWYFLSKISIQSSYIRAVFMV